MPKVNRRCDGDVYCKFQLRLAGPAEGDVYCKFQLRLAGPATQRVQWFSTEPLHTP